MLTPPPPKLGFHDFHDTIKVARALYMYCSGVDSHQQTISGLYSICTLYSTVLLKQFKQKQLDLPDPTNCLKV